MASLALRSARAVESGVEGAYGIARFDRREPVESDEHARSTCGVRELRDAPVRRSVRRWAAAARRPTSIVCWWRSGDAGGAEDRAPGAGVRWRRRATAQQRATNTTLAATRRPLMMMLRPPAARFSYGVIAKQAALKERH